MLRVSIALALGALLFRLVSPSEIRALLDLHLLSLFLVLILAVSFALFAVAVALSLALT